MSREPDLRVVIVSSFTLDEMNSEVVIGGPAYYSSLALIHLGESSVTIVSPAEAIHRRFVNDLNIELISVGSSIPIFNLRYVNGGKREVVLKRKGSLIELKDGVMEVFKNALAIVNPVYRELSIEALRNIRRHAKLLALDIQGFIRSVNSGDLVRITWSDLVYELLKIPDIIHADLSEVPIYSSMAEACRELSKVSNSIVIVSDGERGLAASIYGELYYIPALPGIEGNATGTGDILLTISSYELAMGEEPLRAIAKGAVAAGLRVSRDRPPWFSRFEVEVLTKKLVRRAKRL